MTSSILFNDLSIISYLGLPADYEPLPTTSPISFLTLHVRNLPPHLGLQFSSITTPKQRTTIPVIRNRRTKFTQSHPPELSFEAAKSEWPTLWNGRGRRGQYEGKKEKEWAESDFMAGSKQEIGKLGSLLAQYEEEREAERVRVLRREEAVQREFIPEEEEDESEEEDDHGLGDFPEADESEEEAKAHFERRIQEMFIYGLLESNLYDIVDWDEQYDAEDDRDVEERWFDEEEENEIVMDEQTFSLKEMQIFDAS